MKKLLLSLIFLVSIMIIGCGTISPMSNKTINNPQETVEIARSGCCSWHGGVCGCDTITGMIICCDGTLSPTCRCDDY